MLVYRFIKTTCWDIVLITQHVGKSPISFNVSFKLYYNMKEKSKNTKTIEERILESLLDGPKTNTQLLLDLGYDNKKHGNISKPLDKLQKNGRVVDGRIKSPYLDEYCTLWSLVSNLENFRYIGKYPDLLSVLQKKDFVLEIIAENMRIPITHSVLIYHKGKETYVEGEEELHTLLEEDKKKFKEMLRLSPEFFKYHLLHDDNSITSGDGFEKLAETLRRIDEVHGIPTLWIEWGYLYHYFMVFKACVLMDLLYDKSSDDAENYLIKIENDIKAVTRQKYDPASQ